jgi:hypothetical protein
MYMDSVVCFDVETRRVESAVHKLDHLCPLSSASSHSSVREIDRQLLSCSITPRHTQTDTHRHTDTNMAGSAAAALLPPVSEVTVHTELTMEQMSDASWVRCDDTCAESHGSLVDCTIPLQRNLVLHSHGFMTKVHTTLRFQTSVKSMADLVRHATRRDDDLLVTRLTLVRTGSDHHRHCRA